MKNAASLLIFLCATSALVVANDFRTKVITSTTPFSTDVPEHYHLRIFNFTQSGSNATRGVVIAAAATPTATPIATATPTPTPTCTPTPCPPTPSPTPSPTSTPTPPQRAVLTASFVDPGSAPEPIKQVVVDGPAQITATCPDPNATCVLTYQKEFEPTPTPTPEQIISTATPTPTP